MPDQAVSPPGPDSPGASDRPEYLAANDVFYSTFWATTPNYTARFPNADEASRAAVILEYLSTLAERGDWATHPPRLLDAGCGRGWLTNLLAGYGHAEGCEPVAGAIETARRLFPHLTFHVATPGALRQTPGFAPFDVVVSSEVVEHVPTLLQAAFFADLSKCVRPGGHVILTTPRGEMQRVAGDSSSQLLENWLTEAQVQTLMTDAGLTPIRVRRSFPMGATLLHRVIVRWERWSGPSPARSAFRQWLDDRSAVYQIWLARRG